MSYHHLFLLVLVLICNNIIFSNSNNNDTSISNLGMSNNNNNNNNSDIDELNGRIYGLRKCAGSGCPYAASWLAHINLYKQVTWWLDITKMEAASFGLFDKSKLKFQLNDPDAYYVHHMSMFEHLNHKKYGFEVAKNKTLILSKSAYENECQHLIIKSTQQYLALIPFYGGLPPGVTKDLFVKSIGQGNSLVDGHTKALQTMATVCSCLKYFGYAVIGVARDEDRMLINDMLYEKMSSSARHHINVVQFKMSKPSNLPFHLLSWGQQYIKIHNCHGFYPKQHILISTSSTTTSSRGLTGTVKHRYLIDNGTNQSTTTTIVESLDLLKLTITNLSSINITHHVNNFVQNKGSLAWIRWNDVFNRYSLNVSDIPMDEVYDICHPIAIAKSRGGPVEVVYMKKIDPFIFNPHHQQQQHNQEVQGGDTSTIAQSKESKSIHHNQYKNKEHVHNNKKRHVFIPIKYTYFTECDQIIRFDEMTTLEALSKASNESCFFVSRRREKSRDSEASDYMGSLDIMRSCGIAGYSISWPKEHIVRMD